MTWLLADMKKRYSSVDAVIYDHVVGPAVVEAIESLDAGGFDDIEALLRPGARMLDIGCGGGHIALRLAQRRPDLEIVGMDLSVDQVARARRRGRGLEHRLTFRQGDVEHLPLPDEHFDLVLSVASVKHWTDPHKGLTECLRVLRHGGALVLIETDRGCRFEDAAAFTGSWRGIPAPVRTLSLMVFRTFVAGKSLDLDDARRLVCDVPLAELRVDRVPGAPVWLLRGRKPDDDALL